MLDQIILQTKAKMKKIVEFLQKELASILVGQANPVLLKKVKVDYFGTMLPLNQMANVSAPNANQLIIKPFDRSQNKMIITAINKANLGFIANDLGNLIIINIPPLTEETRKQKVKQVWQEVEIAKIAIRKIRQEANQQIKNSEATDDDKKGYSGDVQELVSDFNKEISNIAKEKENHVLEI